ncbi:MAG: methyltransferase domain-containing protein [Candidatus Omnitrophica bacterium]|nr:methyltransferase domain-containing protein [Candidatus Omnitrophota bacterium]
MKGVKKQEEKWKGDFGKEYIARNYLSLKDLDKLYMEMYGVFYTELTDEFFGQFDKEIKILEVGSNVGNQLLMLQRMGFKNLYGIEINQQAVDMSKKRMDGVNIIQGSAFDIPFKTGYFDLVFTCGVLIHIAPENLKTAMKEIHRCTSKYIFGYEYFSEKYEEIEYRGNKGLMWKTDFPSVYTENFPDSKISKKKILKFLNNDNMDIMFLVEKD